MTCFSKYELGKAVERLTYLRPNKYMQIIEDDKELTVLNGTEYQLEYFKSRFIDEESLEFDYIKKYEKRK